MRLVDILSNNAAGVNGRAAADIAQIYMPVDAYLLENLTYLCQATHGALDYRCCDRIGMSLMSVLTSGKAGVGTLSCTCRILSHMMSADTWRRQGQ